MERWPMPKSTGPRSSRPTPSTGQPARRINRCGSGPSPCTTKPGSKKSPAESHSARSCGAKCVEAKGRAYGDHEIDVSEPCHLVEVEVRGSDNFDWHAVTQEISREPQSNWQV